VTVKAGGSADLTLSFTPTAEGRITGSLSLWLSGEALPAVHVGLVGTSRKATSTNCSTAGAAWAAVLGLLVLARRRRR
jgi:MYXO-CTERM domain-containing protein